MSTQDDSARLAAIGLLNMADDEGYFLAAPGLVRSALWPLDEDSTRARAALEKLEAAGWIEVRETRSHGKIGLVVNFTRHQRVDRATPSSLKAYLLDESSTSPRRILDDRSLLEGKGKEGKGKEGKGEEERAAEAAPVEAVAIPPELVEPAKAVFGLGCDMVLLDMLGTWPADWIRRALSVAVDRGKTGPPYVRGILQRWQRDGKPDDDQGATSGRGQQNPKGHRAGGAYTAGAARKFAGMG
jgi:hypothetical protein